MTCQTIKLPDGTAAIVCSRPRRRWCACGAVATLQCDYPVSHGQTCDKNLCRKCAMPQGRQCDWCPDHPRGPPLMVFGERSAA